MQRILEDVNNDLSTFQNLSVEQLMHFRGIGAAKAIKIKAALELSKRVHFKKTTKKIEIKKSKNAYDVLAGELLGLPHEEFWILYLNQSSRLIEKYRLSQGGITQTSVDLRLAFKRAFEVGATAMVLAHNHPSGGLNPSTSDKEITRKFKIAAANVELKVLDHLIISEKGYFSFADQAIL